MAQINPIDFEAIRNTLSRYCVALDTQDWPLLQQVFIDEVEADYPFSGPIKGWQTVANGIKNRLVHITSQHALTTQAIEIAEDGKTAKVKTYFCGVHFGKGKWKGQEVTAWGIYDDELVIVDAKPELPGASGTWRVSKRIVGFQGRLGNEDVLKGETG